MQSPCNGCKTDKTLRFDETGKAHSCRETCREWAKFEQMQQKRRAEKAIAYAGQRSGAAMDRLWRNKIENRYGRK